MIPTRKLRLASLSVVLACTVGCDQASKHIARTELVSLGSVMLPGGLGEFRLAENPGSFLSLGASLPEPWRLALFSIAVGLGLVVLLAYLAGRPRLGWMPFLGLALVMAGGMSNLIDRVTRQGCVTDFIVLRLGPLHTGVFNAADLTILFGIAALVCALSRRRQKQDPPQATTGTP
jgi:signal peptidase II